MFCVKRCKPIAKFLRAHSPRTNVSSYIPSHLVPAIQRFYKYIHIQPPTDKLAPLAH